MSEGSVPLAPPLAEGLEDELAEELWDALELGVDDSDGDAVGLAVVVVDAEGVDDGLGVEDSVAVAVGEDEEGDDADPPPLEPHPERASPRARAEEAMTTVECLRMGHLRGLSAPRDAETVRTGESTSTHVA